MYTYHTRKTQRAHAPSRLSGENRSCIVSLMGGIAGACPLPAGRRGAGAAAAPVVAAVTFTPEAGRRLTNSLPGSPDAITIAMPTLRCCCGCCGLPHRLATAPRGCCIDRPDKKAVTSRPQNAKSSRMTNSRHRCGLVAAVAILPLPRLGSCMVMLAAWLLLFFDARASSSVQSSRLSSSCCVRR